MISMPHTQPLLRTALRSVILLTLSMGSAMGQRAPADASPDGAAIAARTYAKWVDSRGNILLPTEFATDWTHLGSWAVLEKDQVKDLHGVYAPKEEVQHFRSNGRFPDGAVLVKEVRHARGSAHTTGHAFWAEDVAVWFVMIKDEKGRFPGNPIWGEGWGWGLFKGADPARQAATDYKKDCMGCHTPVKDKDWLYTYAYPVLGPTAIAQAPAKLAASAAKPGAPTSGAAVFERCVSCHSLTPDKHGIGPSLAGVAGRKAGSSSGFAYSAAMKNSAVVWGRETLDRHLRDVKGFIPGNNMAYMFAAGVQQEQERAALIEYLLSK